MIEINLGDGFVIRGRLFDPEMLDIVGMFNKAMLAAGFVPSRSEDK
jgi:hypothetical protein